MRDRVTAPGSLDADKGLGQSRRPRTRILVPIDFSPRDAKGLKHAAALARLLRAKLTLFHVIDVNDPARVKFAGSSDDFVRSLRAKAYAQMDRLVEFMTGESLEVESLIVEGLPWEKILQRARSCDLLIMTKPRPKPFWRLFSKKTTQRVMEQAECAVLVVQE